MYEVLIKPAGAVDFVHSRYFEKLKAARSWIKRLGNLGTFRIMKGGAGGMEVPLK